MPLLMVRNDITRVQADAIVNSANEELLEGSGTSRAIYQAAGETELAQACAKLGHCKLGQAVITAAFGLPAKYIIHAVGPEWKDGYSREEEILYDTYRNSLLLAKEYLCESIAFPLISSGNLGFPKDRAMKAAVSAISDFLMEHEMLVYLVLYDRDSVFVSEKLLGSIEEYIDDNYVEEKDESLEGEALLPVFVQARPENRRKILFPKNTMPPNAGMMCQERAPLAAAPAPKRSLDSLMEHLDETFSQMLLRLIDERGFKDSYVYKKANIDRRHFSKIRNDVYYTPTKKTVIAFAIALELTLDETIDLMGKAGYALSKSSKFDVIISFFLENKSYNIYEINEVLFQYGQPILGE